MKTVTIITRYELLHKLKYRIRDLQCKFLGHKYTIEDWELEPRKRPCSESSGTIKYPNVMPKWVYLECSRCLRGTVEGDYDE